MSPPRHHHEHALQHAAGPHDHAPPPRFSLLRASAGQRLAMVLGAAVVLWAAVGWALWR